MKISDTYWMQQALKFAQRAELEGEVPVGAVLVKDGDKVGEGWNRPITTVDPSAHAEIMALRHGAAAIDNYRLIDTTLYVTLEPCLMCCGALVHARVKRLVFGAADAKAGAVCSAHKALELPHLNHKVEWQGEVLATECAAVLQSFFKRKR